MSDHCDSRVHALTMGMNDLFSGETVGDIGEALANVVAMYLAMVLAGEDPGEEFRHMVVARYMAVVMQRIPHFSEAAEDMVAAEHETDRRLS